ncbi:MAG: BatA domain-containing protein [Gemmatimonadaceae bacterium]
MGLGFLVPALLAALGALSIPVVFHLRRKDRNRPLRFPSLMFLETLPIRTERRQRISDWPLLLVRLLLLMLVVLAFARPVFTGRFAVAGDSRTRAVVILLDRSMSMGYAGVWRRAVDSATAIVQRLESGDRVALVAYDDEAELVQRLSTEKAAVVSAVRRLAPQPRGTRLAPALRAARQVLLDAPFAAAEIIVISDLQRSGFSGRTDVEMPPGVLVRGVTVGAPQWVNSAVVSVEAMRVRQNDRAMLAVKARIRSHALPSPRTVRAALTVNGRDTGSRTATLAANGETVITFAPVLVPEAAATLRVSLPVDALPEDDAMVAVVPRDDALRVAFIAPTGGETLFLERALAIGDAPVIALERMATAPATAASLDRSPVLWYWDTAPVLNPRLSSWLRNGGGIVVAVGPALAASGARAASPLPYRPQGLADRLADGGGVLRDLRFDHPLLAPFRETPDALRAIRLWRYARVDAAAGADVLARFDDGMPALLEQRVGAGRLLAVLLPLETRGGDFPRQPTFLPFVRQLVRHASGRDEAPLWRPTGSAWAIPAALREPVVRTPGGQLLRPRADSAGRAVALPDAGVYTVFQERASGEPAASVAVNVAAEESDLTPMRAEELLVGVSTPATPERLRSAADDSTPESRERRQSLWRLLMVAAVVLLLFETVLATTGRRGRARRALVPRRDAAPQSGVDPMGPAARLASEER